MLGLARGTASLFERRETVDPIHPRDPALAELFGLRRTVAGVDVTPESAMQLSAVFSCVKVLRESLSQLPLLLYERLEPKGKRRAVEHPLFRVLHRRPNPEMTRVEFVEMMMTNALLRGSALAEITTNRAGAVSALWPIPTQRVTPLRTRRGKLIYQVELPSGPPRTLSEDQVLHVRTPGSAGVMGQSIIAQNRNAIGLGMAAEGFGAAFFANGLTPSAVVTHEKTLSEPAQQNLRKSFDRFHGGLEQKHRLLLLEEGMKYQTVTIPPEDAQFLETRKFNRSEIAGMFRVPPHLIADLERATFSNISEQDLGYTKHTIGPWAVRWEQALLVSLLTEREQDRYFAEFLVDALLRADIQKRYEAYSQGRNWGWLSANDVRELENMDPVEGGDEYLIPLNMIPTSEAGDAGPGSEPSRSADPESRSGGVVVPERTDAERRSIARIRHREARNFSKVFRRGAEQLVRGDVREVRKIIAQAFGERDRVLFSDAIARHYSSPEFRAFIERHLGGVFETFAQSASSRALEELGVDADGLEGFEAFAAALLHAFGTRYIQSSQGQLLSIASEAEDPEAALETRLGEWIEKRPDKIARRESIQAGNAAARETYRRVGVTRIRWVTLGKTCPFCTQFAGKVVSIEEHFAPPGAALEAPGRSNLYFTNGLSHPPLHAGCDCQVVADR